MEDFGTRDPGVTSPWFLLTGLAVTIVLLVVLLLGDSATSQVPVVILAVLSALVVEELLSGRSRPEPTQQASPTSVPTGARS